MEIVPLSLCWPLLAGIALAVQLPFSYVFTQTSRYEPAADERFPAGAAVYAVSGGVRRPVAPEFASSADAAVSYDGTRVLFAGKRRPADRWQIWEAPLAGGAARQITRGDADCARPLYLPDGRIVYTRGAWLEIAGEGPPERLTFAPGRYFTGDVLQDGRILFEAAGELYTIYPDGSGFESLRCDHGHQRSGARQLSSGDVVFQSDGRLASIRPGLAREVALPQFESGTIGPVAEAAPGRWLIAMRGAGGRFALYLRDESSKRITLVEAPPGANAIQPAIAVARTPPRDFPSALAKRTRTANALGIENTGAARWVEVYSRNEAGAPESLGRAGVEKDGSFFVEVPGDQPIRFALLDDAGRTLREERNWVWLRKGEQRICTGCHAGPSAAPRNRLAEALRGKPSPAIPRAR